MSVVWSYEARTSLAAIYLYIYSHSPQNAAMVLGKIIELADSLKDKRFEYSIDPIINKQKYCHISIWSYKIIYERTQNSVVILDIFDGRQNPKKLDKY